MTTYLYLYNQTNVPFVLMDADNNFFANIGAANRYSLKLKFSESFQKKYFLKLANSNQSVAFYLNINGEIASVDTSSGLALLRITIEPRCPPKLNNKLIIYPNGKSLPPAPPELLPPTPLAVLYYDDY